MLSSCRETLNGFGRVFLQGIEIKIEERKRQGTQEHLNVNLGRILEDDFWTKL